MAVAGKWHCAAKAAAAAFACPLREAEANCARPLHEWIFLPILLLVFNEAKGGDPMSSDFQVPVGSQYLGNAAEQPPRFV
jgi:hypothetical protein